MARKVWMLAWVVALTFIAADVDTRFPFVVPGDDAAATATDFSFLSPTPAGADGFVRVRDGHFVTDAGRLRIWGVNVCFGGNFPTHVDAEKAAAHLAKLGVNCVRFHHMDTQPSPTGILTKDDAFDPEQVDRLDYFLAQLAKHGIYADLNLHVGYTPSRKLGFAGLGTQHYAQSDKHALHFQPEIQRAIFAFWREFLTHRNPYRDNLRRVDDPAVAIMEMTNENKFTNAGPDLLLAAPEPYHATLVARWSAWLKATYGSTEAVRAAWAPTASTTTPPVITSSGWGGANRGGWWVSDNGGKAPLEVIAKKEDDTTTLRIAPKVVPPQSWHQQLTSTPLTLKSGALYTLRFDARADEPRDIALNIATVSGGWKSLGLSQQVSLGKAWKTHLLQFEATDDVTNDGRLAFDLGGHIAAVELRNVKLSKGGGDTVMPDGQSVEAGNVELPDASWALGASHDFLRFMHDTELAFYREAKRYLIDDLGVKAPVTTTQANYQPMDVLDQVADFADMHAYWHHPIFHGRQWDANSWTVQNETLVAYPFDNGWPRVNLLMRTPWRVEGKPFTFTEWNTGEPGYFSADGVPIAATIAALQDWDAVFFFQYHGASDHWATDHFSGFFDVNGQPCKSALMGACAAMFRRGDVAALTESALAAPGRGETLGALGLRYRVGTDPHMKPDKSHASPDVAELKRAERRELETPDGSVRWDAREMDKAFIRVNAPASRAVWGLVAGRSFDVGGWSVRFGPTQRDYAVLVATSLDGKPLEQSASVLITAVGNAENQDMVWNADRTSVGTKWGHGPTLVNGINATLTLPASQHARRLFVLDGTGKRTGEVELTVLADGSLTAELGPRYKTLWYELAAE